MTFVCRIDQLQTSSLVHHISREALAKGNTAYAFYFDHKRRTDPEFRKALKRESRKEARAAKEEAEAQGAQQKEAIKAAVEEAREEGFPTNTEDKEAYFMSEVGRGEALCADGKRRCQELNDIARLTNAIPGSDQIEAAICFYKALKVYPAPSECFLPLFHLHASSRIPMIRLHPWKKVDVLILISLQATL